jgi:hypothetical protein
MANQGSQAEAIRTLLIERLQLFDPSLSVAEGSPIVTQVVEPVFQALGTDPFDTDIETFLRDRIRQEFPTVAAGSIDAITQILLRPLQLLQETLKREIEIIRRGQSTKNSNVMRLEDAEALAANFFVPRRKGSKSSTTARIYYSSPTFVAITSQSTFFTRQGLRFFPVAAQFYSAEILLLQQSGNEYYIDVNVIAEFAGTEYNVGVGDIVRASGVGPASRVTNLAATANGLGEESATALLSRTQQSLTERSLNTRRGILTRLFAEFPATQSLEVVGFGDPEMLRDIITGRGHGLVRSSGMCFIVGQYILMFSTFEDRGLDGTKRVMAGDDIDLNYWKFLFDLPPEEQHETFSIEEVLYDSRDSITENIPSILLLRISGTPTPSSPAGSPLPGVLAGVFSVVRSQGVLEVSDIPGGILQPTTSRGTVEINDGEIHVGGHYDIWVRPSTDSQAVTEPNVSRSETYVLEGIDLVTNGASLTGRNRLHRQYILTYTVGTGLLSQGEVISGGTSGATATVYLKTATTLELVALDAAFEIGELVTGASSGATATITAIASAVWPNVEVNSVLSILRGVDVGAYVIRQVDGLFLYLDTNLTASEISGQFRVVSDVTIDLFSPKTPLVPFAGSSTDDLRTTIGSATVKTALDLQTYGVLAGDTLEILDREDVGIYSINGFDSVLGGKAPILSAQMGTTNSGVNFRVYRPGAALQPPVIRIIPEGLLLLDASGTATNATIPPSQPVDARPVGAFSGAEQVVAGANGFVLLDPGTTWQPTGNLTCDPDDFVDTTTCLSDACLECEGYIACVTLTDDGKFYLNSGLPAGVQTFLTQVQTWLLAVIDTFFLGDDIRDFVTGFNPVILGPPDTTTATIKLQFEVCLPAEMFDGCNNVFVALPEFDWEALFSGADSFAEILDAYNNGTLQATDPALLQAQPGDAITIRSGSNAGSYIIHKILDYRLCTAGAIVSNVGDLSKCYRVVAAVIDGEFPVSPLSGVPEFFAAGPPDASPLPTPPDFPGTSFDDVGNSQSPWEWVELTLTWLFQWLISLGFDLPDTVTLDAQALVQMLWELFFNSYTVHRTTAEQTVRVYFTEPTSLTAIGLNTCAAFSFDTPTLVAPEVEGKDFTLPLPDLENSLFLFNVKSLGLESTFDSALDASFNSIGTISALAVALQTQFDPAQEHCLFSGPATPTGKLKMTAVEGGIESFLYGYALDVTYALRAMGFWDSVEPEWAEKAAVGVPTYLATHITLVSGVPMGFDLDISVISSGITLNIPVDLTLGLLVPVDFSFTGLITRMQDALILALTPYVTGTPTAVVAWNDTLTRYTVTLGSTTSDLTSFTIKVSGTLNDAMDMLFGGGGPFVSIARVVTGVTPNPFAIYDLNLTVADSSIPATHILGTSFKYSEAVSFDAAIDAAAGGDADALAAALNAFPDTYSDGTRRVWYIGGTKVKARSVYGGSTVTLTLTLGASQGFTQLGFVTASDTGANTATLLSAQGDSTAGAVETVVFHPDQATLFAVAGGATELLFVASGDVTPYQVIPGQTSAGVVPATELPRDISISVPYAGNRSAKLRFSDLTLPAPFAAGLVAGDDYLYLYPQRELTESSIFEAEAQAALDRVIAVTTVSGSTVLKLPPITTPDFTFLSSMTTLDEDVVQVGDLVFLEEGDDAGGYVVTARSATELTVSKAMSTSSGQVYRVGNDGTIDLNTAILVSNTAAFVASDVGKYLTIWATNRNDYAGSFLITAVTDLGAGVTSATLDTDVFPFLEEFVHWAVVRAPIDPPGASGTEGRTALVGLRPARIYSGTSSVWRVSSVEPELDRTTAIVEVALPTSTETPKLGVKQPYQFVRPGVQHTSSTMMENQRERGLYYADVVAKSLGGESSHNIPAKTYMVPIFGTFTSDGYRLETEDNRLSYSPQERLKMVLSPSFLPAGSTDVRTNKALLEGRRVRVTYDVAPLVDQIQQFVTSEADRNLCASPLVRHFLPGYVYLDITYVEGDSSASIATSIRTLITELLSTDPLDVSQIEEVLHQSGVRRYEHPIELIVVTHDLDRRAVVTRSEDKIDEEQVNFNGSNRITYFIAGPDRSAESDESAVPTGERTYLIRKSPTSGVR